MFHFLLARCKQKSNSCDMAIPPLPLTKPHLDQMAGLPESAGAAGEEEMERRAQEVLLEWLLMFFNGQSFATPGTIVRSFDLCHVTFDEATPKIPQERPILHLVLADRNDKDPRRIGGGNWIVEGTWRWTVLIRTNYQMPPTGTDDSAAKNCVRACRRVGDQLTWLLRSAHTQALTLKGLRRAKAATQPKLIPAGAYHARMMTLSAEVSYTIPGNDP